MHCGRGGKRESSPSRSVFAEVSPEREREAELAREPSPVRGNKLRDDKPFSMDDGTAEEREVTPLEMGNRKPATGIGKQ